MKKINRLFSLSVALGIVAATAPFAAAQDYDDDLYYTPSQAKKDRQARQAAELARQQAQAAANQAAGLGDADSYTEGSSLPRSVDVDTYNRRYSSTSAESSLQPQTDNFSYTRRIERFHNPNVVTASGDTTLMDYYAESPSQQDINVYVINSIDPIGSYMPWSYYNSYWNPYIYWNWCPSFSFGWNFGPFYAGWNWGWHDPFWGSSWGYNPWWGPTWHPSWAWGHSWGHHWGPGWGWGAPVDRHWGHNRPGANRPHRPSGSVGATQYRPGNGHSTRPGYTRPGNNGRPSASTDRYRPGNNGNTSFRPNNAGYINAPVGTYSPTNNDRRGRNNNVGTRNNSSSRNNYYRPGNNNSNNSSVNRNNSNANNNSYRTPGSGSRGRNGGSSIGGGSRNSGGGFGHGGGSRGRGR